MDTKTFILNGKIKNSSILDKQYSKHIYNLVRTLSDEEESRWETYGVIIQELFKSDKVDIIQEIKYRLTDNENPTEVFLNIYNKDLDNVDDVVWILKKRIEDYLDEDTYKRFYI
jgi:hypothetical protein